ncbi:hypothetical protein M9458_058081, partial [Cirrhinus mrigala]
NYAVLRAGVLNVISLLFLVNYTLLSGQEYSSELRCSQGRSTQRNFIVIFSELRAALRAGVLNLIHFVVILVNYAPQ